MTTTEHPRPVKVTKDGRRFTAESLASQAEGQVKGLAILAEPWTCPFCQRDDLTLRSKGIHLRHCKLNPDHKRKPVRRGQNRPDAVACEFCEKKIAAASMQGHVDTQCRVARAIREGRLVLAPQGFDEMALVEPDPVALVETPIIAYDTYAEQAANAQLLDAIYARVDARAIDPFPAAVAEEVINLAVAQVMDGRPFSYVLALEVAHRVDDLVAAMKEAW